MIRKSHPQSGKMSTFALVMIVLGCVFVFCVVVFGALAAIAIPNFLEAQNRARAARTKADLRSLATALEAYCVDNNTYPMQAYPNLTTPVAYITAAPPDPFRENETFEYGMAEVEVSGRMRQYYVIYGSGPDCDLDIQPGDIQPRLEQAAGSNSRAEVFFEITYDPTNGVVSNGDIIRTNVH